MRTKGTRYIVNRSKLSWRLRLPVFVLVSCITFSIMCSPTIAWNSKAPRSSLFSTHKEITKLAVKNVKAELDDKAKADPEGPWGHLSEMLTKYEDELIDGSNNEDTHKKGNFKIGGLMKSYNKTFYNDGTNWGSNTPSAWLDAWEYCQADPTQAYYYLGSLLHLVEDQAVPAHAMNIYHGLPAKSKFGRNMYPLPLLAMAVTDDPYNVWDNLEEWSYRHFNPTPQDNEWSGIVEPADYYFQVREKMFQIITQGDNVYDSWARHDTYGEPDQYCVWELYWLPPPGGNDTGTAFGTYGSGLCPIGPSGLDAGETDSLRAASDNIDIFNLGTFDRRKIETTLGEEIASRGMEEEFANFCQGIAVWGATETLYNALVQSTKV